jgi:hypothetical protein
MVKLRQSGEEQIPTILGSVRWIMAQPTFALGVNDARAGRPIHPDYDLWDTNGQWNYERGRCFAKLASHHLPLRINGQLNPEALRFFRQCGGAIR